MTQAFQLCVLILLVLVRDMAECGDGEEEPTRPQLVYRGNELPCDVEKDWGGSDRGSTDCSVQESNSLYGEAVRLSSRGIDVTRIHAHHQHSCRDTTSRLPKEKGNKVCLGNRGSVVLLMKDGSIEDCSDAEADKPGRRRNLKDYNERVATFNASKTICWPRTKPTAEELAHVGFVYTGHGVVVECFACGAQVSSWDDGKEPLLKHYSKRPRCPFLKENFKRQLEIISPQLGATSEASQYANTSLRLHSFDHWPFGHIVTSYQLASVGFYYSGRGAQVCCFSCGITYDRWKPGDVPLLIHRQLSPLCQFLQQLLSRSSPPPAPLDLTPSPPSLPSPPTQPSLPQSGLSRPDYTNEQVRLKSFKHLPRDFPSSKEDCARAGLYFVRKPDVMKCFSCDAVVSGWVVGDTAIEKHREISPRCKFLREHFPSKMDSASSDEVLDPSTLPEPQFTRRDLQELSRSQHPSASLVTSQLHSLSLTDPRPPSSLPPYISVSRPHVRPLSHPTPLPSYQHSESRPSHPTSKYMYSRPLSSLEMPYVPRPRPREEYVGPSSMRHQSSEPPVSMRMRSLQPSLASELPVALPPSYQRSRSQATPSPTPPPTEDGKVCVVCMDEPLQMVLMPCGHVCVCEECSKQLSLCPMCRKPFDRAYRVFLPY